MANWTSYYKFVKPSTDAVKMTDSQEMADAGAYNNYTWYQRLIQGSASRMTRYREYDLMDNDVEVSRALDTIAEELTGNNSKTDEPLDVDLLSEDEENVESSVVLTLKAALRRWGQIHDWENKLYSVARMLVKYGDVFFRKGKTQFKKWEFIHPKNIVAAIVDSEDATKVVAWQVKKNINKPKAGGYGLPLGARQDSQYETEIVEATEMVRFTLNDDMCDTAPFGESVLRPVYRSHKQKELLEDAIIIYRVQRAPERRVFYIDVGKMPPQRVKQYLESIKNEIKQKKIPTAHGGQAEVDSVYNPHSMCLALDTEIPLLDGRTVTLQDLINEHNDGKENWAYSINPKTGKVVPGLISWAGVTRKNAETIKLTLDNGDEIICTPDHKFPIQGKGFVEAKDITPEDSLWPFNTRESYINERVTNASKYTQFYNPQTKGWVFSHRMVANFMKEQNSHNEWYYDKKFANQNKNTIHHRDFNEKNNSPNNLCFMNANDHAIYHLRLSNNQEIVFSDRLFERFEELSSENIHKQIQNSIPSNFGVDKSFEEKQIRLLKMVIDLVKSVSIHNFKLVTYFKENKKEWNGFRTLYHDVFSNAKLSIPEAKMFERIAKLFGYSNFKHLVNEANNFNHRVIKIEKWESQDTGTLTIDGDETYHSYHTFALTSCFTKNSEDFFFAQRPDGRGSKVDTLPGGQGLGELADLEYFQKKVWRGLKVPASYMQESEGGGQMWNDGKVGVAYIQELRFSQYVERLQSMIETVLDDEFKKFLKLSKIIIDDSMYRIRLPSPSNFGKYRQFELDSQLLSGYGSADGIPYLSKRFILERFLMLSDEEVIRNERMFREERGLDPDGGKEDYMSIYGGQGEEMGGLGGGAGMMGGGMGGMDLGMEAGEGEAGAEGGMEAGTEAPMGGGEGAAT